MEKKIGVIDIGSNSVRLNIAERDRFNRFRILEDVKVNVRLGKGLSETGKLFEDRMAQGIETLKLFRQILDRYDADRVAAVATAAVRKAENGQAFVKAIQTETGFDIKVISGIEEASLDYLGAMSTLEIRDGVLMDIGGGSIELVLIRERKQVEAISIPVGAVDLTERFGLKDQVDKKDLEALKDYLETTFEQIDFLKKAKGLPIIGVGGTIRNVGRIHRRLIAYPMELTHHYEMLQNDVELVCKTASKLDLEARKDLKGLSKGRADVFIGAAYALKELMLFLDSEQLIISDAGLREGLILKCFGENDVADGGVFEESLMHVAQDYEVDLFRAAKVYRLMQVLLEQLQALHGINRPVNRIMKISAMLRDSGVKIRYRNYPEHSFYLILNSALYGVSQKEILMSALAVLNHKSTKKLRIDERYSGILKEEDEQVIEVLSLFLQISDALEKAMASQGELLFAEVSEKAVKLLVSGALDPSFAERICLVCGKKFKRVFDKELIVSGIERA